MLVFCEGKIAILVKIHVELFQKGVNSKQQRPIYKYSNTEYYGTYYDNMVRKPLGTKLGGRCWFPIFRAGAL